MELNEALKIANAIKAHLAPDCEKIDVAGSCRRQKPEVKDIEIVCTPRLKIRKDLFGDPMKPVRTKEFVNKVNGLGKILKGSPATGRYVQIKLKEGINLDLFIPEPDDYYRQFAIRTGSAGYSKEVIAFAWVKLGWVGSDLGLRRQRDCVKTTKGWHCVNSNGKVPPVWKSEEEFFKWLNVEWVEPRLR